MSENGGPFGVGMENRPILLKIVDHVHLLMIDALVVETLGIAAPVNQNREPFGGTVGTDVVGEVGAALRRKMESLSAARLENRKVDQGGGTPRRKMASLSASRRKTKKLTKGGELLAEKWRGFRRLVGKPKR